MRCVVLCDVQWDGGVGMGMGLGMGIGIGIVIVPRMYTRVYTYDDIMYSEMGG